MVKKWQVNLLLILSAFTLVGVGFSSWAIIGGLNEMTQEKNGSVVVDEVAKYISIDATKGEYNGRDIFFIDKNGFCDNQGNLVSPGRAGSGSVTYYFSLKLDNIRKDFEQNFKIVSYLKYISDDKEIFDLIFTAKRSVEIEVDSTIFGTPTNSINIQDNGDNYRTLRCTTSFSFNEEYYSSNANNYIEDVDFSITYTFNLDTIKSNESYLTEEEKENTNIITFFEDIYPYLSNSRFEYELGFEEVN